MFHPKRLGLVQYPNQVPGQPWVSFTLCPPRRLSALVCFPHSGSNMANCVLIPVYPDTNIWGKHCGWPLCNSTRSVVWLQGSHYRFSTQSWVDAEAGG